VAVSATFNAAASSNANLSGINLSAGTLIQGFTRGGTSGFLASETNYSVWLSNSVAALTITPVLADMNASVNIDNATQSAVTISSLVVGDTETVNIEVTAQDGSTAKSYTLKVTRLPNASLASINLSNSGLLYNSNLSLVAEQSATTSYNGDTPTEITFTAVASDAGNSVISYKIDSDDYTTASGGIFVVNTDAGGAAKAVTIKVTTTVNEIVETKEYVVNISQSQSNTYPTVSNATGGTISYINTGNDDYDEIHIFDEVGNSNFVLNDGLNVNAQVLVVAGGGGGGGGAISDCGGGGGAGGLIYRNSLAPVALSGTYSVTVGDGKAGGANGSVGVAGTKGEKSSITGGAIGATLTAIGGGGGGNASSGGNCGAGQAGGSGGGGGAGGGNAYALGGNGTEGQGKNGDAAGGYEGGGGGGAALTANNSVGGSGLSVAITGEDYTYAKGGNGGSDTASSNGVNYGDGGTGGKKQTYGGSGHQGIVVIRFPYTRPASGG
jgi:hypothetical protein